ncbi:MAG: tRNA (adenosine(37)-N6)-threonylcarbamoyltransferase complex dimerization subunit type 1 TsaB [Lachnospiraceae bacterium]|nr:tRNA (adenosine(37)-N6)-threonylcarbamoyltransferase complex dimerization subunit type 1 TsaB [Lachnospiraceae bacterium]
MKILALDSSGLVASVALAEDDNLIAEYTIQYKKTHSQTLLPMLEEIRDMVELDLSTVDAIAVAAGPGSFTGLRIGSATAKGLAFAMAKPIVPVPTLEGLAYQMYGTDAVVCPIMDARRSQVYTGIYEFIPSGCGLGAASASEGLPAAGDKYDMRVIRKQCAVFFDEIAEELNRLGRKVVFVGDGIPVFKARMKEVLHVPFSLAPAHRNRQSAACIAALGSVYYAQGKAVSGDKFVPDYLRLSQAERERAQELQKITYRRMTSEDVPFISKLEEETFSMPWSAKDFLEMINKEDARYYVAERDGQLLGGCGVLMAAGEGNITNVVIAPEARNQGVGTGMLRHLLKEGEREGLKAFTLEVRVSNAAAIHVYEKLGFVSEGIRPGFYEKPVEDAMIYWKR